LDLTLDLIIPCHITVRQAIRLIADVIDKKEQVALDKNALFLFDNDSRTALDKSVTFDESRVPDACSLILI
jgi:hypothetical protein